MSQHPDSLAHFASLHKRPVEPIHPLCHHWLPGRADCRGGGWNGEQEGAAVFELRAMGRKDRWGRTGEGFIHVVRFPASCRQQLQRVNFQGFFLLEFLSLSNFLYYLNFLAFLQSAIIWARKGVQPEFVCRMKRKKRPDDL